MTRPLQSSDENAAGKPPASAAPAQSKHRLGRFAASIRTAIILPYSFLTITIALLGLFIVLRLLANSIEERFTNQLLEAGRAASDGLVREERHHLEILRPLSQTVGLAEAVEAHNITDLRELVEVHAYNGNLDSVLVLDATGELLLRLDAIRKTNSEMVDEYQFSTGGNYAHLPIVASILAGYTDERGDKFAGLVDTPLGPVLYTSAPVVETLDNNLTTTIGVVVAGTTLDRMLLHLQGKALANISVYGQPGPPISSTIPDWKQEAQQDALQIDAHLYEAAITNPNNTPLRDIRLVTLFQRDYRAVYSPMIIREQTVGVMAVLLPARFVLSPISTSRDTFILIFSLGIGFTILIGLWIARRIIGPIFELVRVSRAVADGDLTQRVDIQSGNELGILSQAFNEMTARLDAYTSEIKRENARTNAILGSIVDGVILRDPAGQIILANPAAKVMLSGEDGFDPMRLETFSIPRDQSEIAPRFEIGTHTISISMAQVHLPDQEYLGDVLVLRDVTREAVAERTKDSFLNQISHELRTPLTAIQGYADILRKQYRHLRPAARERAAESIYQTSKSLAKMIDQIIDLTAMQSGSLLISSEKLNLVRLVNRTVDEWQQQFSAHNLEPIMTASATEIHVIGDARRLDRVLDALFRNACEFSPDGGILDISIQTSNSLAILSVSDPGVGIAEEDMPHIFERFYRGSPKDQTGKEIDIRGVGQGLFVVKSIVEAHGGTVGVESIVGKGSTFRISLPLISNSEDL
ncbi:MAG: HAMP domain-containing protein [Anaerolineae bacterium]|nr:HAMP domain-containing protein [Anaerolineae bacterium]